MLVISNSEPRNASNGPNTTPHVAAMIVNARFGSSFAACATLPGPVAPTIAHAHNA